MPGVASGSPIEQRRRRFELDDDEVLFKVNGLVKGKKLALRAMGKKKDMGCSPVCKLFSAHWQQ